MRGDGAFRHGGDDIMGCACGEGCHHGFRQVFGDDEGCQHEQI